MIFSDIFKYYLICFETATEDEITDICNNIDNIKIHNLLNSNKYLIDRFRFVVLVYDKENPLNDISINVFLKFYDKEEKKYSDVSAYYLFTIFLNNNFDCKYDLDIDNEPNDNLLVNNEDLHINNIEVEIDERNLDFSQSRIEKNYYVSNDTLFHQHEILNMTNEDVYNILTTIRTGYYLNINDITWQFIIKQLFSSNEYNYIDQHSSKYVKNNILNSFFPSYNNSLFESYVLKHLQFTCSYCHKIISKYNENYKLLEKTIFYFNNCNGCLCKKCFASLKEYETNRKNFIKSLILLEGRKIIFRKELEKTRNFLKKYKFKKIKGNKKILFLEKTVKSLIKNKKTNDCPICLDELNDDISTGTCGHCYHTKCITNYKDECPVCRKKTKFIKLFLS